MDADPPAQGVKFARRITAYMTVSRDYPDFIEKMDRFRPRYSDQLELAFDYEPDMDDGKGL